MDIAESSLKKEEGGKRVEASLIQVGYNYYDDATCC